jgi:hypothetical protein
MPGIGKHLLARLSHFYGYAQQFGRHRRQHDFAIDRQLATEPATYIPAHDAHFFQRHLQGRRQGEVATIPDPLPESILSVLYKETRSGDDMLTLKMDETYRGGARHRRRLIENRKRQRRRGSRS